MFFRNEIKRQRHRLREVLPWETMAAPDVVRNEDGSYLSVVRYRGNDLNNLTEAQRVIQLEQANMLLRRITEGWAVYFEEKHLRRDDYPDSEFPDPYSFLVDKERKARFEAHPYYESEYYFTLMYLPPKVKVDKAKGIFIENLKEEETHEERALEKFIVERDRNLEILRTQLSEMELLEEGKLLTYLKSTCSSKYHPVNMPEIPIELNEYLEDSTLITDFEPKLSDKHIRVVGFKLYPNSLSMACLDRLAQLPIEYRRVIRFVTLGKLEGQQEVAKLQNKWRADSKGLGQYFNMDAERPDLAASRAADSVEELLAQLKEGYVNCGYYSCSIIVLEEKREDAIRNAKEIERVINNLGFVCTIERENAAAAWLGAIPGITTLNPRKTRLSSKVVSALAPINATWGGPQEDRQLGGPVLLHAYTATGGRFRFTTTVGGVGHCFLVGPTGAGKSVALNVMDVQFRRYPNARNIIFDKGGSSRILTYAVGGAYYDIGASNCDLQFQPLKGCNNEVERSWCHGWIMDIFNKSGATVSPQDSEDLWNALTDVGTSKEASRSLHSLYHYLQNPKLKTAIKPFTRSGQYGRIFDGTDENIQLADWIAFDLDYLLEEMPAAFDPAVSYLFHKVRNWLDGRPTQIRMDEMWAPNENPDYQKRFRAGIKEGRKYNARYIFATQSIDDVERSGNASAIRENTPTKIFLPNSEAATNSVTKEFYTKYGLNEKEIETVASAQRAKHYFIKNTYGSQLIDLGLGELTLSICGATSKKDQILAQEIKCKTKSREEFLYHFLKEKEILWPLESLKRLVDEQKRREAA